ncbi:MAG: glycosyltransferase family 39 protein [Anaerolineaceae bacterium]|nr:MAG: glycosyltransferase family 39 protein [Anaerolineaceae bacterium]
MPFSIGLALTTLAWSITRKWKKFAFWFTIALVGQAVGLQLIDAGQYLRYQHYKPLYRLFTEAHPLLLIYLGLQTTIVLAGIKTRWSKIQDWLGCNFKRWQLFTIGLIFFISSATVSHKISLYIVELFFAVFIQTVNLGTIVLMIWAIPKGSLRTLGQKLGRLLGQSGSAKFRESAGIDRFVVIAAVWVTFLSAVLNLVSYQRHPHVTDEVVYLIQARYLAKGILSTPAPPVPEAFEIYLMRIQEDRWYPSPPVGWPLMLALGVLLGVPWLVNPVLAGLNVLLSYRILLELYDRRTARVAVILLCFSPWYIFMAMNFMTHTFTLTCTLAAVVAIIRARKRGKAIWGWLAGSAVGMVSLIRPLNGLIVAGLLGLWAVGVGGERLRLSAVAGLVLGTILVGATVFPYNKLLTGDPSVFPIMAYADELFGSGSNLFGFGPDRGMGWSLDPYPGHSPRDGLINANLNLFSVNIELFGWSIGSLLPVALMFFSGSLRRSDYLMVAVIAAIFGVYFFYYYSGGPDFGARYWFLMILPLVALAVRGIQVLEQKFQSLPAGSSNNGSLVIVAVFALSMLSFVNFFPWRAIDKYYHYRGMRPDIRILAKERDFGKSLVLIRGNARPDYASAAAYNPVDLNEDVPVYAWDKNPEIRKQVLNAFPARPIWMVNGPTVNHEKFEVIKGPLSSRALLTE